jgi:tRNA (guanine6-N2)-methyltransferase
MGIKMLVTCDTGFEKVLVNELEDIMKLNVLKVSSGRVFIEVLDKEDIVNVLRSRIANNVYILLHVEENVNDLEAIYRVVKGIDFASFIEPWQSFAIRPERIGKHNFTSIDIGRVAGQAVIDGYLESRGVRLKVDLDNPDVEVYVELNVDKLIVGLSLTRSSLHNRKYKLFAHPAGLKPTIAFALLKIADWVPGQPILDPMCGGGTIVIEAALASKGVEVPCIAIDYLDINILNKLCPECGTYLHSLCFKNYRDADRVFVGVDINPRFVEGAIVNAKNAGVDDVTLFLVGDLREVVPKLKGIEKEFGVEFHTAVFNPPYGHRMKPGSLGKLYEDAIRTLINHGFRTIIFITSATKVSEKVLANFNEIEVEKFRVMHSTLPSYVYRIRTR